MACRSRPLALGLALLGLALLFASSLSAEEEPRVNASLYETDLRQALADMAADAGVTIVAAPEVSGFATMEIVDQPLSRALDMLLAGTGYVHIKLFDYYFVCPSDPESPSFAEISRSRMVKLNYAKADAALAMLAPGFRKYCQANPEMGAISITAPTSMLDRLEKEIRSVDIAPRHIILDAMIVVMEKKDLLNLGVQWGFPTITAGAFSNDAVKNDNGGLGVFGLNFPWGIQVGYSPNREFTNSLQLTLNLLSQNDEATIIASPQVMAQDGKEASIEVITEEYFQVLTNGYYYAESELEKIDSGTILKIKPQIGDNGEITLQMASEVSDVIARFDNGLPVVTRRKANTTVRVEDGGTAAVAGLIDSRIFLTQDSVPYASKIPGLGELFKNDNNREQSRQVAVFVTARLLADGAPACGTAISAPRKQVAPVTDAEFKPQLEESLKKVLEEWGVKG